MWQQLQILFPAINICKKFNEEQEKIGIKMQKIKKKRKKKEKWGTWDEVIETLQNITVQCI